MNLDLHVRQVGFKTVSNGYLVQYAQQTNQVATQEEAVFNTLGQVEAHIAKLDEQHKQKVKAVKEAQDQLEAKAPPVHLVEAANGN